ncbi:MAG TPA: hypothetical protein VJX16_17230 [Terriglobales bacterium]|nr:hypothetical protein [Terriglobales bacterium]
MKRTIFLSLAVLLSLLIGIPVRAQEGTPKSDQHKMSAKKRIPRPWRTKDGFQIANVPRISEDKETEFAIVRLSDAEYKKFQENPKDWVNDHHIFKAKVREMKALGTAKSEKDPPPDETYWYVVIGHWPGSTAVYTTYSATEPS